MGFIWFLYIKLANIQTLLDDFMVIAATGNKNRQPGRT
jgi:hypothetical protein